jgi:hypothetical protein
MRYGVNVNSNYDSDSNFTAEVNVFVDSEQLYQWADLLYGTEEQIISVFKIKEHFF